MADQLLLILPDTSTILDIYIKMRDVFEEQFSIFIFVYMHSI